MSDTEQIGIRHEELGDRAAIQDVLEAAFEGAEESKLVDALRRDGDIAVALVAETDGKIVGYIGLSKLKSPEAALALAPLAVYPAWQNRGIGADLVNAALVTASEHWEAVFVLGAPEYYTRFGFTAEAAEPFQCRFSGPHLMAKALVSGDLDALDRTIVYPDAFSAPGLD